MTRPFVKPDLPEWSFIGYRLGLCTEQSQTSRPSHSAKRLTAWVALFWAFSYIPAFGARATWRERCVVLDQRDPLGFDHDRLVIFRLRLVDHHAIAEHREPTDAAHLQHCRGGADDPVDPLFGRAE